MAYSSYTLTDFYLQYGGKTNSSLTLEANSGAKTFYTKLLDIFDSLTAYIKENPSDADYIAQTIEEVSNDYLNGESESSINYEKLLSVNDLLSYYSMKDFARYEGEDSEEYKDSSSIRNYVQDEKYSNLSYLISFFGIFDYTSGLNGALNCSSGEIKKEVSSKGPSYYHITDEDTKIYKFLRQIYSSGNDEFFKKLLTGKHEDYILLFRTEDDLKQALYNLIVKKTTTLSKCYREDTGVEISMEFGPTDSNVMPILYYVYDALKRKIKSESMVAEDIATDARSSSFFSKCINSSVSISSNKNHITEIDGFDNLLTTYYNKYKSRAETIKNEFLNDDEDARVENNLEKRYKKDEELNSIKKLMIGTSKKDYDIYPSSFSTLNPASSGNTSYIMNKPFDISNLDKVNTYKFLSSQYKEISYENNIVLFYSEYDANDFRMPEYPLVTYVNYQNPGQNLLGKLLATSCFQFKKIDYETNTKAKTSIQYFDTWQFLALTSGELYIRIHVDDKEYNSIQEAFTALYILIEKKLDSLLEDAENDVDNKETQVAVEKAQGKFINYVNSRLTNSATEKDFFFINSSSNKKVIPSNPFVDIEFAVPKYENGSFTVGWLPVTSVRSQETISATVYKDTKSSSTSDNNSTTDNSSETVYAGSYFNSFELEDLGSTKKISLVLKSPDDCNLEKIIEQSLTISERVINVSTTEEGSKQIISSNMDLMQAILDSTSSNFRIRFGYRDKDCYYSDSTNKSCVYESDASSEDFLNRTKKTNDSNQKKIAKPVMIYPWSYFKITGVQTSIINNENTYTIEGIDVGSYVLSSLSLTGCEIDFKENTDANSASLQGTPANVLGTVCGYLNEASNGRICVLGSKKGKIVTGCSNNSGGESSFTQNEDYILDSNKYLEPSDLDIEKYFFAPAQNNVFEKKARNFTINSESTPAISITNLLNKLVDWLPRRFYYICANSNTAVRMKYEEVASLGIKFYNEYPHVSEPIKYQVIRAKKKNKSLSSNINPDSNAENIVNDCYFIRLYFEGPGITSNEDQSSTDFLSSNDNPYFRVYNYKNTQSQVIKNVNINNGGLSIGNIMSAVSVYTKNDKVDPLTFIYSPDEKIQSLNAYNPYGTKTQTLSLEYLNNKSGNSTNKPRLTTSNVTFAISTADNAELKEEEKEALPAKQISAADAFFTAMCNQAYTGEITIMGDPFYYFDSSLEPGKYEIYLNMNRIKDFKSNVLTESYFSGVYTITGVTHSISGEKGNLEYTTKLKVAKYTF